jgi:multiple sugar transport system ATP-binding protein
LVRDPAAFLLDEPLSNLDAKLRVQTRSEIAQLHRRLQATFVYVTHDQVEAMTMSDRIAVMMGGRILQCAPPHVVYDDPDTIEVAEFIGSPKINILPVELEEDGRVTLLERPLDLVARQQPKGAAALGLRPEALQLAGEEAPIRGHVAHAENLGAELYVQIQVPGLDQRITFRTGPKQRYTLGLGAPVGLAFDPAQALLFDGSGQRLRNLAGASAAATRVA